MPAESKKQQRFFGLVKAIQEGKATGSSKAKEVAESMPHKAVRDYAATNHEDLPESKSSWDKSALSPEWQYLLNTAALSAGLGLGGAGAYGLTKLIHDKSLFGTGQGMAGRIKKKEKLLATPKSPALKAVLTEEDKNKPSNPAEMTSDAEKEKSDLTPAQIEDMTNPDEDAYKQSNLASDLLQKGENAMGAVGDYLKEEVGAPGLRGALYPIAFLAPGLATFIVGKRLINQYRKANIKSEIADAKKEFEQALSKTSNDLQAEIDSLWKQADSTKWVPMEAETVAAITKKTPEGKTPAAGSFFPETGLVPNSAWLLGLAPGVGALIGWHLMSQKMKKDPDVQKLKELNSMLKRDIASGALSNELSLEESKKGKPVFKL